MRVILIYDVSIEDSKDNQRLNKVRKVVKKYLHHVQKSVFEGEITLSNLEKLKYELRQITDLDKDSIIIYIFESNITFKREIITKTPDPTSNII